MTPRDDGVPPGFEAHTAAEPERRPLFRELPPAEPFPMTALGPLRPAADAIAALTQAPVAMCAQSVLASASLAVCPHYDVILPTGQQRPTAILAASVAGSGERKTSVDAHATAPVRDHEKRLAASDEGARTRYWADREAWKAASEAAKKLAKKGGRTAIRAALEEIGPEPKPPPLPMLLVSDPTPESIALMLADGRPYAGLFADEGGSLIGGHSFTDESKMRTGALLNGLWDGSPIRRLRVLTGARFAPGRRLAAHLMMQQSVADRLLGDAMLADMGLVARMLIVAPAPAAGSRMWREPDTVAHEILRDYGARMADLLRKTPRLADAGALDPVPLVFTHEARRLLIGFHDAVERQLAADGTLAPVRAFGAKMMEHACRVAAIMGAFGDPEAVEIGAEWAGSAVTLVHHYAGETLRLADAGRVDPDLRLAARLLAWWQARPSPALHLAEIYQRGLNALGSADDARRIVAILADHGWARRLGERVVIDGVRRREAWTLT